MLVNFRTNSNQGSLDGFKAQYKAGKTTIIATETMKGP